MTMCASFSGKVVIVTGASSGLGHAMAVMMAARGACVSLCGRNETKLEEAARECAKASKRPLDSFLTIAGDITSAETRQEIVDKTVKKFGRLDTLVNNAGISLPQNETLETSAEAYDQIMDVNLKSAFFLSQAAVPQLQKTEGCIVNISSILSTLVGPKYVAYAMSKAGMDHMTRTMAAGLAQLGIRVNAVNPSFIDDTGIARDFPPNADARKQFVADETASQPLHSVLVTADDIAKTVCFLASQEARFVTGQCHVVDGGRMFSGSI